MTYYKIQNMGLGRAMAFSGQMNAPNPAPKSHDSRSSPKSKRDSTPDWHDLDTWPSCFGESTPGARLDDSVNAPENRYQDAGTQTGAELPPSYTKYDVTDATSMIDEMSRSATSHVDSHAHIEAPTKVASSTQSKTSSQSHVEPSTSKARYEKAENIVKAYEQYLNGKTRNWGWYDDKSWLEQEISMHKHDIEVGKRELRRGLGILTRGHFIDAQRSMDIKTAESKLCFAEYELHHYSDAWKNIGGPCYYKWDIDCCKVPPILPGGRLWP